jgi:hypothetical protein
MGKNSVIKTLVKRIGNVVLHYLIAKNTKRPESIMHLKKEEITYRDAAIKESKEYNWNESDKREIKKIAINFIKNKHAIKYPDVNLSYQEAESLIEKEIKDLNL